MIFYQGVKTVSFWIKKNLKNENGFLFLSNCKQFVLVGNIKFTMQLIFTRVPQGLIVGPFIFNICINDIVNASSTFAFLLYADDTTLNISILIETISESK